MIILLLSGGRPTEPPAVMHDRTVALIGEEPETERTMEITCNPKFDEVLLPSKRLVSDSAHGYTSEEGVLSKSGR